MLEYQGCFPSHPAGKACPWRKWVRNSLQVVTRAAKCRGQVGALISSPGVAGGGPALNPLSQVQLVPLVSGNVFILLESALSSSQSHHKPLGQTPVLFLGNQRSDISLMTIKETSH